MGYSLGDHKCGCGAPATKGVRDMREIEPTPSDEPGYVDECWEPVGEPRIGCDEHPPEPSKRYYRDGRILETAVP